ncbi:MAG TPA: hypothetical protein VMN56_01500 [Casimicrobiaceae bacterium]|nr:hypothetical protein [Casimicrobiaceae bacterium]
MNVRHAAAVLGMATTIAGCATVPGYQVVVAETALDNSPSKQLQVSCPAGKRALGAGWGVLDSTSAILEGQATYFEPAYDGASWLTNAKNLSAFSPQWKLQVRVICANVQP